MLPSKLFRLVSDEAQTSFGSSFGCFESKLVSDTLNACDFATVQVAYMTAIQFSYEPSSLPTSFNAEDKWGSGLISGVEDQAGPQPAIPT
jgi:hypothetical protein